MNAEPKELREDDAAVLPGVLGDIARALGVPVALKLAHALGGTYVNIGSKPRPGTLLVKAVGLEAATRIAELLGKGNILIPLGPTSDARRLRRQIARLLDQDMSCQTIARQLHVHVKTVWRHKAARDAARQGDLFS